jgi:hypothetical protein
MTSAYRHHRVGTARVLRGLDATFSGLATLSAATSRIVRTAPPLQRRATTAWRRNRRRTQPLLAASERRD